MANIGVFGMASSNDQCTNDHNLLNIHYEMMRLPVYTLPLLDHLLYMVVTDHHMPRVL